MQELGLSVPGLITAAICLVSIYAESDPRVKAALLFNPYLVRHRGQYHRLLTGGFVHGDYMHLAFNMLAFYTFSESLQYAFLAIAGGDYNLSQVYFCSLFFLGILFSHIPGMAMHSDNPGYNALGASGGVSAILLAFILFFPRQQVLLFFFPMPAIVMGVLYLGVSFYYTKRGNNTGIGHEAHLFGAIFGILFTVALEPGVLLHFWNQLVGG